jgi:hypothetical protein
MKDVSKLFESYKESGVYSTGQLNGVADIEKLAVSHGFSLFKIDLGGVLTREGFLRAAARALQFPSYFGMNWDALEECLTDFEWCTAMGYVIIIEAAGRYSQVAPEEYKMVRNICKDAAKFWKKQRKPFYVILEE